MSESEPTAGKSSRLKTILVVFGLMVAEAAAVYFIVGSWGNPSSVQADVVPEVVDQSEQISEILILSERFPNHQTGRVWLWETEIQVQVKSKHFDYVQRVLEERNAEIKTGISQIIRTSHHRHLTDPTLETLSRQVAEYLGGVFGSDSSGDPRVQRVLIPKCVGFPADY